MHMFSKTELKMLSDVGRGSDTIESLIGTSEISWSQVYKTVRSLKKKDVLRASEGKVFAENKTHVALLMNVLRSSHDSYHALSDRGLDILAELIVPHTMKELSETLEMHQTTVSRKLKDLRSLSMIGKENGKYFLNRKFWPELLELAESYSSYKKNIDLRAIPGSKIYHSSDDLVVFSNDSEAGYRKTAFSKYTEFGIKIREITYFYCDLDHEPSLSEVFLHSLYVISVDDDWSRKMIALIFYVKFKDELTGIEHEMKDEMDRVLSGSEVKGWVPLNEMRERADMYGVKL